MYKHKWASLRCNTSGAPFSPNGDKGGQSGYMSFIYLSIHPQHIPIHIPLDWEIQTTNSGTETQLLCRPPMQITLSCLHFQFLMSPPKPISVQLSQTQAYKGRVVAQCVHSSMFVECSPNFYPVEQVPQNHT